MAPERSVTDESLGAWVLKCNPDVWDLASFLDEGESVLNDWSVVDNYRSRMMAHGQKVLFWVTSSSEVSLERGFWGSGWVTGPRFPRVETQDLPEGREKEQINFWLDRDAEAKVEFFVDIDVELWDKPVSENEVLSIPSLQNIEVIRMRQGSSPSWISKTELSELAKVLPPWPPMPAETPAMVVVAPDGAGFGDPATRALVEAAAIKKVCAHYRAARYTVKSVERDKCGWDLTCTASDGREIHVEVKGVSGSRASFLLTRNEFRSMETDESWKLALVTNALSKPRVKILEPDDVRAASQPYVYKVDLPGG